jgi:APA family basic amino acid/polyamine antiporter
VPLAIIVSVLLVAIVYVGITLAMLMSGKNPFGGAGVAEAANILMGPWGGALIAVAACVSTLSGANAVILGNSELLVRMAGNGDIPSPLGHISKSGHAYASVLLTGGVALILMLTGSIQNIVAYCSVAGIVGLVLMNVTALQMSRKHWPGPGLRLPFGILVPLLATILALGQLPSLGWVNVLVGILLVSVGLVVYALRSRSRPQDRERHDDLVKRLETPLRDTRLRHTLRSQSPDQRPIFQSDHSPIVECSLFKRRYRPVFKRRRHPGGGSGKHFPHSHPGPHYAGVRAGLVCRPPVGS